MTDFEWSMLEPLIPTEVRDKERIDNQLLIDPRSSTWDQRSEKAKDQVAWVAR
ncbi:MULTISPECIES: hypothetical protein [Brucella/Ochrobactrum group]|uniref:hypothetical protein n=1 Tax=Brucella/Ochrobactrum group TaxID=2826938 RepID=UPI001558C80E|nr:MULTISPECIES: hypothetical protein [Brucella/Ochrobactrum group]MCQ9145223.1 hypothetical protein [Ochrobactrum sp. BTU2]NKC49447.1 hypothetical protein [Brucella anthropi ATCC 49188]UGQ23344.1 hypothetical protein LRL11_22915 [Brucella anthropi]